MTRETDAGPVVLREAPLYAAYLAAQALAGVVLWIAWGTSTTVRSWFELLPEEHAVMDAFVFADLGVAVVGSAASAWALRTRAPWALPVVAFTAGAMVYPTLYLVGWVSYVGTGALCLAIMVPPSIATAWITYRVWRSHHPLLA